MPDAIFFASCNAGKIAEVTALLAQLDIRVTAAADDPGYPDVAETGASFLDNARLKAEAGCRHTGLPTLAEDAGLEVFALDMEPGIYSARYKGSIPQAAKNLDIIARVDGNPAGDRRARFHSAMVFVCGGSVRPIMVEGFCYGEIAREPAGTHGFGYDPIFLLPELGLTMAQMPVESKNRISHRANALHALHQRLDVLQTKGIEWNT